MGGKILPKNFKKNMNTHHKQIISTHMTKPEMIKVADLREHNLYLYGQSNAQFRLLVESIKATGGILEPVVINMDNKILSGVQRVLAYKELGYEEIPAIVRDDIAKEDEAFFIISYNRYRTKTMEEITKEMEVLKGHWGMKQGQRNDLKTNLSKVEKQTTRQRIADELNISEGNIHKIEKIAELNPTLLGFIDKKELSIHQAYKQATGKVTEAKSSKPASIPQTFSLHTCPNCGHNF